MAKQTKGNSKLKHVSKGSVGKGAAGDPSGRPKSKSFDDDRAGNQNKGPRKVKEGAEDEDLNIGTDTA